jgi:thymidylate synthase
VARELGVAVGTMTMTVKSAHIYQAELAMMQRLVSAKASGH